MLNRSITSVFLFSILAAACGGADDSAGAGAGAGELAIDDSEVVKADPGKADSSYQAVFVDFAFDAELHTQWASRPEAQIEDQLLYTIGQLNGERAVGRLDKLVLTDIQTEELSEGGSKISYHATLLVAWNKRSTVPAEYTLRLPLDVSYQGQQAFTDKYSHDCVDYGAHDVTSGSMWYYYRPGRSGCDLDGVDVIDAVATVSPSPTQTTGKYPEYDMIWEDGVLNVVAVFGKYEDGATSGDAGVSAYQRFHSDLSRKLQDQVVVVTPDGLPSTVGVDHPEISYEATLDADHKVVVTAMLVDNIRTAGPEFDARYAELSKTADLLAYNGHAGLGANIKAMARKGSWVQGQYVVVFMNGCDTYAYVDTALFDAHAAVNPDDPAGTKHVDIVTNAMPSFFRSMAEATLAIVDGFLDHAEPQTYEQIFRDVDSSQVILVSGEEDNTYVPGDDPEEPVDEAWAGLSEEGTVAKDEEMHFATPVLPAGAYVFKMTGTSDADLYVRTGKAPTTSKYDCRPYKTGSAETCTLELPAAGMIHGMIRGYASSSNYELVAAPR